MTGTRNATPGPGYSDLSPDDNPCAPAKPLWNRFQPDFPDQTLLEPISPGPVHVMHNAGEETSVVRVCGNKSGAPSRGDGARDTNPFIEKRRRFVIKPLFRNRYPAWFSRCGFRLLLLAHDETQRKSTKGIIGHLLRKLLHLHTSSVGGIAFPKSKHR